MSKPTTTTDEYLAALPAEQRAALEKLHTQVRAAAPGAVEAFAYGLPAFRLNGHPLLYFGAAKHHCALYGAYDAARFAKKLANFKRSKGAIQFTPSAPLPPALVKELVRSRVETNHAKWGGDAKRPKARRA